MKNVNIGLIGFGTVGSGVYHLLKENSEIISKRSSVNLKIKTVCDLSMDTIKKNAPDVVATSRWQDITSDPEIDVVVELIGGIEPAKSIILEAMKNGKSVVSANKKLIAETKGDVFDAAEKAGVSFGFEASVCGGIPCILSLKKGLVGNRVKSVTGILNGTTNYILSKMEDESISFAEALALAQSKGFAEADPTFDIEGYDAGHKISILSMISFNKRIDYKSIMAEGITKISAIDISNAREMGYVIKLLGIAKSTDGGIDVRVHPAMISRKHPLASVRNEFNAVMFDCDMTGPVILYGRGAGSNPTASAVVSDIVMIAGGNIEAPVIMEGEARLVESGKRKMRYYLRIQTEDRPGILSKITGVLGKNNISIASVVQKEEHEDYVPLIIITHEAMEDGIRKSISEIEGFDFVNGNIITIRIED